MDSYKNIHTSVRPPRIACLLDINDPNWQKRVEVAIESFSRIWGGAFCIFIPTDGEKISKTFWEILFAYDPDLFAQTFIYDNGFEKSFSLKENLSKEIFTRLSPFYADPNYFEDDRKSEFLFRMSTYPNFVAHGHCSDMAAILPYTEHLKELSEISNVEGIEKLWVGSSCGLISPKYKQDLESIGVVCKTFNFSENELDLFQNVVYGVQNLSGSDSGVFPFTLSMTNLAFYMKANYRFDREATLIIVGDEIEDFCLYYALSRMRRKVAWFLPSWIENENLSEFFSFEDTKLGNFCKAARSLERFRQQQPESFIYSISKINELGKYREIFKEAHLKIGDGFVTDKIGEVADNFDSLADSIKFLLQNPSFVYEVNNVDKVISKHFVGTESIIETPKPINFSKIPLLELQWLVEFWLERNQFPRHPMIGKKILHYPLLFEENIRSGKNGIVYRNVVSGYLTGDIDQMLHRPKINVPNAKAIYQTLLESIGLQSEVSDKGSYSEQTINKFNDIDFAANYFINTKRRKLFDKYFDKELSVSQYNGISLNDKRRYLDLPAIEDALGDKAEAGLMLDIFLSLSILHRGLILKCCYCRNSDWFDISEFTEFFRCKRCRNQQRIGQFSIMNKIEPVWYYKLDEIVYRALEHNFIIPLLSLYQLKRKANSFDYSPELLIKDRKGQQIMEIDICCIVDGKLIIGEAKMNNKLASTQKDEEKIISRFYELSEKLGISQIVFATNCESWREKTIELIQRKFRNSLTSIIFMSKNDLYQVY